MKNDTRDAISVMISFDDPYVLPAAALISSILFNIAPKNPIKFYLLYHGNRTIVRSRIDRILENQKANCVWLYHQAVEEALLKDIYLNARTNYPPSNYSRLLIADLLPSDVERVIYLDADTLVRGDISKVWKWDMNGNVMCAAPDPLISIDAPMTACGIAPAPGKEMLGTLQYKAYLSSVLDEDGDQSFHFSSDDTYFQAGVLVLDLKRMRDEGLTVTLIDFIRAHSDLCYPDQDALNIVFRGRIGRLDPAWNVTGAVFHSETAAQVVLDGEQVEDLAANPALVHFTLRPKPWQYGCTHPFLSEWYDALDRTPWRGWRATRINHVIQRATKAPRLLAKRFRNSLRGSA